MASLPASLPSLEELIERARAPDAARAEAEALIAGLSLPLDPEQSPRQRADLLLSLIEDAHLGSFTGSKGRTVRAAAVQALIALGYPYALEVPPEAFDASRTTSDGQTADSLTGSSSTRNNAGLVLICLLGLAGLLPVLYLRDLSSNDTFENWLIAIICGTTFFPALLAVLGRKLDSGFLRGLASFILVVASMPWLITGVLSIPGVGPASLIPLFIGALFLLAMVLLRPNKS